MNIGSLVIVLGGFDKRVRDHDDSVLTMGTLEQVLVEGQVSVLMEDGTLWVGPANQVVLAEGQE